jgi:uncharacterized protein YbjT (DUF2867 family)
MRVLITGASGFIGSQLLPHLHREGHDLRVLARTPERLRIPPGWDVDVVTGEAIGGEGLAQALAEIDVAYYLIHSMESASAGEFKAHERRAAENFVTAAQRAGVKRIVYLGGPMPRQKQAVSSHLASPHLVSPPSASPHLVSPPSASPHLASRLEVERILLEGIPGSVALRASIVIGARSRSFRFMVRLVERMPVLTLPAWRRFRTQPIDARDVIEMLAAAAREPHVAGQSLDIGGPQALSYGEMLRRIAELMLVDRPALNLRINLTPITARLAAAVADEDPELTLPLMESLNYDLLLADNRAEQLLNVHLHSFDAAVEHALREWEATEPLRAR